MENEEEWRKAIRSIIEQHPGADGYSVWELLEWDEVPTPDWPEDDEDITAICDMCYDEVDKANVTVTWGVDEA